MESEELKDLLEGVLDVRGVVSAAVAAADGSLVQGLALGESGLSELQELVPTALASSRALGALLGEGPVVQSLVEYAEGPVLLAPVGADDGGGPHVVVVGLKSVSDLGRVRFQLKRMLPGFEAVLVGEPG